MSFDDQTFLDISDVLLKNEVNKLMRNTHLIEDPRLRVEIEECIECDDMYSPLVDRVRR